MRKYPKFQKKFEMIYTLDGNFSNDKKKLLKTAHFPESYVIQLFISNEYA